MVTEHLIIVCDEIDNLSPGIMVNGTAQVKMMLDDVDIDHLMIQLVKKLDTETILDYLKNDSIVEYLKARGL